MWTIRTSAFRSALRPFNLASLKPWTPASRRWFFPNRTLENGESVSIDGLTFTAHHLGFGESNSDSYWAMEGNGQRVAFIGDVVLNRVHAYGSDAHTFEWLRNLNRLITELHGFDRIYPGHGDSGGIELLEWQKSYLQELRSIIKNLAKGRTELSEAEKAELVEHLHYASCPRVWPCSFSLVKSNDKFIAARN
jgi:glyoxylase-like metal-dependent hydrolase (beta-lactamase superfamily II)